MKINASFSYGNRQWQVPEARITENELVLPVCCQVPLEEWKAFYDRYSDVDERKLTKQETADLENRNPLHFPISFSVQCNGIRLRQKYWRNDFWTPYPKEEKDRAARVMDTEALVKKYRLDPEEVWVLYDVHFKWDPALGEEEDIDSLSLELSTTKEKYFCGSKFEAEDGCQPFEVEFSHVFTGNGHRLLITGCEAQTMERNWETEEWSLPSHYCALSYTVTPPMPEGDVLMIEDCAEGDRPIPKKEKKYGSAAAVSIIGGSDGPTSVFLASSACKEQEAYSSLTFCPREKIQWAVYVQRAPFEPREFWLKDEKKPFDNR